MHVHTCDYFPFMLIYSVVGINCHKNVIATVVIKSEKKKNVVNKKKKIVKLLFI